MLIAKPEVLRISKINDIELRNYTFNPLQAPRFVGIGDSVKWGKVVVKIANPMEPGSIKRMEDELTLRESVLKDAPYAVSLLEWGEIQIGRLGSRYLVEPWAGEDLANHGRVSSMGLQELTRVMREVSSGLLDFHQRGVAHGDVKLNNVAMRDDENSISLIDYGHSVFLGQREAADRPTGWHPSLAYPPEHLTGYASDCYSLGVAFHNLIHKCNFLTWRWGEECVKSDGNPVVDGCWPPSSMHDSCAEIIHGLTNLKAKDRLNAVEALSLILSVEE